MRTIKFRGKNPRSNQWETGNLVVCENGETRIMYAYRPCATVTSTVIPETVGQFTGLTDKNGVEIYEGDIATDGENIYTVEFSMWSYAFVWNKHGSQNNFHFEKDDNQEMELVGNIYDNPELRTKTEMKCE